MPDDFLDAISAKERRKMWKTSLASTQVRTSVAVAGRELVGFVSVGLRRIGPHEAPSDPPLSTTGELYSIYLVEEWVGHGVGRALMQAGETAMRDLGASFAILWVLGSNTTSHRFYEACGWRRDGATTTYDIGGATLPVIRFGRDL
jgi:GNAT superfamily N-acetyltransferase